MIGFDATAILEKSTRNAKHESHQITWVVPRSIGRTCKRGDDERWERNRGEAGKKKEESAEWTETVVMAQSISQTPIFNLLKFVSFLCVFHL